MSDCPRFGKWIRGCNFEAVYNKKGADFTRAPNMTKISVAGMDQLRDVTYVHHVCTTCGKVSKGDVK